MMGGVGLPSLASKARPLNHWVPKSINSLVTISTRPHQPCDSKTAKPLVSKRNQSMEDSKSVHTSKPPIPRPPKTTNLQDPSHTQTQNPPSSSVPLPPTQNNKRKFDNVGIQYCKIRALVRDLRPHFLEVLKTPDFRNSKAAHEIRKQMKLVIDAYKLMIIESANTEKSKNPSEGQTLLADSNDKAESKGKENPPQEHHEEKQGKPHPSDHLPEKSPEITIRNEISEDEAAGMHVVGGSNFGWNFIMFPGRKPFYYGVTKESWRAKQATK